MSKCLEMLIKDEVKLESFEAASNDAMNSLVKYVEESIDNDDFDKLYQSLMLTTVAHGQGMASVVMESLVSGKQGWTQLYVGAACCAMLKAFNTVVQREAMKRKLAGEAGE